jgi:hypothetical protein
LGRPLWRSLKGDRLHVGNVGSSVLFDDSHSMRQMFGKTFSFLASLFNGLCRFCASQPSEPLSELECCIGTRDRNVPSLSVRQVCEANIFGEHEHWRTLFGVYGERTRTHPLRGVRVFATLSIPCLPCEPHQIIPDADLVTAN